MEQKKNRNKNTNGKNTNMFKRKTFVQNKEFWMLFLNVVLKTFTLDLPDLFKK